jgi:hypothetical protein
MPTPIRFLGRTFAGGYGMMHASGVSFAVEPAYRRFVAVVGCCENRAGPFEVLLDDQVAWSAAMLDASEPALQISVDIPPGAKKLTLRVGDDGALGAACAWANAGFMKGEK